MSEPAILNLPVEDIIVGMNPRKHFDRAAHDELVGAIREVGILQPIVVRPRDGAYELVVGERRLRACKELGLEKIPAIVRDIDDNTLPVAQLVENSARDGLSPLDEAMAVANALEKRFGPLATQEEKRVWAEQLGWGLRKLQYALALANASDYVQFYGAPFSVYTNVRNEDGTVAKDESGKPLRKRNEFPAMDAALLKVLVRCNNDLRKFDERKKKENGSHKDVAEKTVRRIAEKATLEGWSVKKLDVEAKRIVSSAMGETAPKEPAEKAAKAPSFVADKLPTLTVKQLVELDESGRAEAAKNIQDVLIKAGFRTVTIAP